MARREKMSAVDTAWLRMDRPGNLMMICGVLLLRGQVSLQRLRRTVEQRFSWRAIADEAYASYLQISGAKVR